MKYIFLIGVIFYCWDITNNISPPAIGRFVWGCFRVSVGRRGIFKLMGKRDRRAPFDWRSHKERVWGGCSRECVRYVWRLHTTTVCCCGWVCGKERERVYSSSHTDCLFPVTRPECFAFLATIMFFGDRRSDLPPKCKTEYY